MMRRRTILFCNIASTTLPRTALAQRGASRPIIWIVPFAAGTIADVAARLMAGRMSQTLEQPMRVENRPGAGGAIGTEAVIRAAPDGHTLLYGGLAPIAAAPHLVTGLRYDPGRDLVPVHGVGASPNLMMVGADRPWATLEDFVAEARAAPGAFTYASPGIGTAAHLSAAMLQQVAKIRLTHLSYANSSTAFTDVASRRGDAIWDAPITAIPHLRQGRLQALAVAGPTRVNLVPSVPTVRECGFPGAEVLSWAGVFAPARTPAERVVQLAAAAADALRDPAMQQIFANSGVDLWPDMDQVSFAAFLAEELPRIANLISHLGTTLD